MSKTVIIDYDMGNLDSVKRAVEECGGSPVISNSIEDIESASSLILPGVGAFSKGMEKLKGLNLVGAIRKQAQNEKIPMLGICLGMQLMATIGYENGTEKGIDLIPGKVIKFNLNKELRVPHIGWNEVNITRESVLFSSLKDHSDFYFVHSYHFVCDSNQDILACTDYGGNFISAINRGNIFGTQFHPEKSQKAGFQVLRNFLSL